jgi:uncharacterized protein YutE (UPF0331/DUF86 family)
MTDSELLLKKIAFIEGCVRDLAEMAQLDRFERDIREQRFILHTLQLALQATLDIASHIVSARRLGEPSSNRELFLLLGRDGWITPDQVSTLQAMAGMRNILVHGYLSVDAEIIADVVETRLGDLLSFAESVRARVSTKG